MDTIFMEMIGNLGFPVAACIYIAAVHQKSTKDSREREERAVIRDTERQKEWLTTLMGLSQVVENNTKISTTVSVDINANRKMLEELLITMKGVK